MNLKVALRCFSCCYLSCDLHQHVCELISLYVNELFSFDRVNFFVLATIINAVMHLTFIGVSCSGFLLQNAYLTVTGFEWIDTIFSHIL
jgi:hypothetical protein